MDDDALIAAVDLVGRTGARGIEIGYLHDNVPVEEAAWYAHVQYRGTSITEENHRGPVEAAEALARQLLTGAMCNHCKKLVALSDDGATAYNGTLLNGTRWTVEQARAAGQCRWRRIGPRWARGCEGTKPPRATGKPKRKKGRRKRG
ncbi:hypothetical protein HD597_010063 [Nonomuraea thailandensis]|uniref:Uncharacterized protein n=1 Tax=Nonomuraea thailandensis TaxID=1188745 RepID=A0A9X2GZ32_9ACTN|nr:hypothetical protein [Nonomuraea thailandensis]MCP2363043.1 hypothetical protein [Nonomuraea thailandensis]